ncbi:MAG: metallophosphoesterase family protein [Gammaproteobacteria bacterium]
MTQLDLGALHGPLLLFGGSYSNVQATQAMQQRAEHLLIEPENIICTGDSVAYCAQPNETLECLRNWGVTVLMGNCEESLAWDAADCGCGFESGSACDLLADSWYRYASKTVQQHHKDWMRTLPRVIRFRYLNRSFMVVHGGVEQINQFIFASTDQQVKLEQVELAQVDGVVAGHCGLPFTQIMEDKLWHNPGVIGMPANDGTRQGWYSLWRPDAGQLRIEHHRLDYDAIVAQQHMLAAGLDNGYAEALTTGLWPSMDVLPARERAKKGQNISESIVLF